MHFAVLASWQNRSQTAQIIISKVIRPHFKQGVPSLYTISVTSWFWSSLFKPPRHRCVCLSVTTMLRAGRHSIDHYPGPDLKCTGLQNTKMNLPFDTFHLFPFLIEKLNFLSSFSRIYGLITMGYIFQLMMYLPFYFFSLLRIKPSPYVPDSHNSI